MIRTMQGDLSASSVPIFPKPLKVGSTAGDGAVRDADTGYFTITGRIRRRAFGLLLAELV